MFQNFQQILKSIKIIWTYPRFSNLKFLTFCKKKEILKYTSALHAIELVRVSPTSPRSLHREQLSEDVERLARGSFLVMWRSTLFGRFSLFSSFHSGVRSSKEYSRYRKLRSSNINYVRTKQVNRPESFKPVQSFRTGAKHRVASTHAPHRDKAAASSWGIPPG